MTELRKPEAPTPEAFTKLARECRDSSSITFSKLAIGMSVTPARVFEFTNGTFAKQDFRKMSTRKLSGAVGSLTRFCWYFNLDLASCIEACGIPEECFGFPGVKDAPSNIFITKDEWEKVSQIIDLVGALSINQIDNLIRTLRKNSQSSA